jgi:hypothetical protein
MVSGTAKMNREIRKAAHFLLFQVEGSYAEQRKKVAGLNQRLHECILPGDVLRAVRDGVTLSVAEGGCL